MGDSVDRTVVLGYASRIPWDSYVGTGRAKSGDSVFLDADDVRSIKRCGLEDQSTMDELLATDPEAKRYPQALIKVLTNITDSRVLQFALTLLEDFLAHDAASRTLHITKPGSMDKRVYLQPFLQLVGTSGSGARIASIDANAYIVERAAVCVGHILSGTQAVDAAATSAMLAWVITQVRAFGSVNPKQVKLTEIAVSSLMLLLRNDFIRRLFVEENGIQCLVPLLSARNTQLLYEVAFCLWTLSLQSDFCPLLERAGAVTGVSRLVRVGMPLKVIRVSIATLVNAAKNPECTDSLAEICETHVPDVVEALTTAEPKITDAELADDLRWLAENIKTNRRKLTSLERYEKDVAAKHFEWTPIHSSDFWKENSTAFEAGDFRLIKLTASLLSDPNVDNLTLAVALFDLGEFAVNHPQGRTLLQHLGIRPAVMAMLKREDEEVKQQALLACSKMLVTRWQFVAGSAS